MYIGVYSFVLNSWDTFGGNVGEKIWIFILPGFLHI